MNVIFNFIKYTFIESLRNKVFFVTFIFGLFLLVFSKALAALSFIGQKEMLFDFTLAGLNLVAIFLSIFMVPMLFQKELGASSLLLTFSKPISRWQFIVGKFLGYFLSVNAVLLSILIFIIFFFYFQDVPITGKLPIAFLGIVLDSWVSLSFVFIFTILTSPFLSLVLSFSFWLICQSHNSLKYLVENSGETFVQVLYFIVNIISPNFSIWNWKDHYQDYTWLDVSQSAVFALLWGLFYLLIVLIIFRKKDCV